MIDVDKGEVIIFITVELFLCHFNRGLGGKVGVHRKISWVANVGKWCSRFEQCVYYQVHYKPCPSVDGALGTNELLEGRYNMFVQCADSGKVWAWRANEGGLFRNTTASSYVTRWSIVEGLHT